MAASLLMEKTPTCRKSLINFIS